ncbi:MAG TPA: hypothetical protein VLN74_15935, partial [Ilumatobacteraceae bacterium]|nr:hypothetical protein [Ilumatobacteraceae bacterium]
DVRDVLARHAVVRPARCSGHPVISRHDGMLLAACTVVYLSIATRVTDGLGRTQFDNRAYADFFDIQAEALLRGDLALPANSLGLEAFVVDGREQMYFGLFPALTRVPITALTDAFSGRLTVVSSLFAWLLFVASAWALVDRALPHLLADEHEPEQRVVRGPLAVAWKVGIALGTPMLMLAGPVWVFSEAIMWGVASCTFVQYRLFRELEDSSARTQWWLGGALALAALNRPTLGLGCVLVVVAVVAMRSWRRRRFGPGEWRLAGVSAASLLLLVLPNMLRFGRPLGPPMELQVLSQVDEQRMRMLAYAGGDFVDPRYLPTNLLAYLRPDGLSVSARFPFLDAPHQLPHVFGDAVYDITYRTPSLPAATPLLFGLGMLGLVVGIMTARDRAAARWLLVVAAVGVPAGATLLIWGFLAPRYLADFVVTLLPLSVIGLAWLIRAVDARSDSARRWFVAGAVAVAGWSVAANIAMALSSSYLTGPDGGVGELVALQGRGGYWTSGDTVRHDDVTGFSFERDDPPPVGQIAVLGDCAGAWFSTGEPVDPWLTLGYGPNDFRTVFDVSVDPDASLPLEVPLATFSNVSPVDPDVPNQFELSLVVGTDGAFSLGLADEFGVVAYELDAEVGDTFELAITSDPVRRSMFFEIDDKTVAFGHVFTRSLYGPDGQEVSFADGYSEPGVDVVADPGPRRC